MNESNLPVVIVPPSAELVPVTLFDDSGSHWPGQFLQVIEGEEEDLLPAVEDSNPILLVVACDENSISNVVVPGYTNPVAGLSMFEIQMVECRGCALLPTEKDLWDGQPPFAADSGKQVAISSRGKGKPRVIRARADLARVVATIGRFTTVNGQDYVELVFVPLSEVPDPT